MHEPCANNSAHLKWGKFLYWVYNLLGFSGTNILSANSRDARFPKWVRYKFKPNHQDTEQLTAEQRKRLWLKAWDWEAKSFGKPMFPHPEAFADECL